MKLFRDINKALENGDGGLTVRAGTFVQIGEITSVFDRYPTKAERTVFRFATNKPIEPVIYSMVELGFFPQDR